jgi:hypothetical protein
LTLKRFDYMTREQLQVIHDLKSPRNANRFLNSIGEYLNKFRNETEFVYYLSKEGRERVDCPKIRKKTQNVDHYLLRNQLWIHLGKPHSWENEVKVTAGATSVICDAKYTKNGKPAFIEVDISQPMSENKAKIERYRKIKEETGAEFYLIWVTALDSRKSKLNALCQGFKSMVYTLKDIN